MAYKIPKNLTKYSETFLWGMSFKQFGYAALTALGVFFIFAELEFAMWIKIMMATPILVIGLMFIYGKVDEKIASKSSLRASLRKVGYYDPKIDNFVPVKEINDNTVFLKNERILAVLEVNPIDFTILSEDRQEYVLNTYSNWLRSLDYEVQITCRSIDLDMSEWLNNLSRNEHVKKDLPRFNSFRKWIQDFTEKNKVRNRVFYIVIPMHAKISTDKGAFKSIMDWITAKQPSTDKDDPAYQKALSDLATRVNNCREKLRPCGLELKRLNNDQLLGLYSSYFTNVPGGGRTYLTPVMWSKNDD